MTDSEIIKALECCITTKGGCKECPLKGYGRVDCQLITATVAYRLINRQQIEIEKAKSATVKEFAEKLKEHCNEISNQEWNKKTLPVSWADAYEGFIDDIDRLVEEMGCNDGK